MSSVANSSTRLFWFIVLSVFVSPLPVLLENGCGLQFFINLLLWALIPFGGFVHAIYLLSKARYDQKYPDYDDVEGNISPVVDSTPLLSNLSNNNTHNTTQVPARQILSQPQFSEYSADNVDNSFQPEQIAPCGGNGIYLPANGEATFSEIHPPPYDVNNTTDIVDNKIQHN